MLRQIDFLFCSRASRCPTSSLLLSQEWSGKRGNPLRRFCVSSGSRLVIRCRCARGVYIARGRLPFILLLFQRCRRSNERPKFLWVFWTCYWVLKRLRIGIVLLLTRGRSGGLLGSGNPFLYCELRLHFQYLFTACATALYSPVVQELGQSIALYFAVREFKFRLAFWCSLVFLFTYRFGLLFVGHFNVAILWVR